MKNALFSLQHYRLMPQVNLSLRSGIGRSYPVVAYIHEVHLDIENGYCYHDSFMYLGEVTQFHAVR